MNELDGRRPPNLLEVRDFYRDLPQIYAAADRWHAVTKSWISDFIRSEFHSGMQYLNQSVLNLGSGGQCYGLPRSLLLDVDLHRKGLHYSQNSVIADIQFLPFKSASFLACICVGSVLNHCDAASVIHEIGRILKPGGTLVLEFESSAGLDLAFSGRRNNSAVVVTTFYHDRKVRLWAYSEKYILMLLKSAGLNIVRRSTKHHLSALVYLFCRDANFAARFHCLDKLASRVPFLRKSGSHVILSCQKGSP